MAKSSKPFDSEAALSQAIKSAQKSEKGKPFYLKELFFGLEWSSLEDKDRRYFGRRFCEAVKNGRVPNVEIYERKGNGVQYVRK